MRRLRLVVEGRVQGVGYRWFCRDRALALSLTGWVCNLPDGGVELEAQGPAKDLALFLDCLREGPPMARVLDLRQQEMCTLDREDGFVIRH